MKFATIGSYLLDDIIVYGREKLYKDYDNVARYTCISPISFCHDQKMDESILNGHKRSCSNPFHEKMQWSELKNSVLDEIKAKSPDFILIDFSELLSPVYVIECAGKRTAFTFHAYMGNDQLLPNERLIKYPATLSDNGILDYSKKYIEMLIKHFGKDKLILVKTKSCYQYFDQSGKWKLAVNAANYLSSNRLLNNAYELIQQSYFLKEISMPDILVNDLSYNREGEYKLAEIYYDYLNKALASIIDKGICTTPDNQLYDKLEEFFDSKLMIDVANQTKMNGIDAGKKLVMIGKSQFLEDMLYKNYGTKIYARIKYDKNTSDEDLYTETKFLHGKSSKYYLILPHVYRNSRALELLIKRRYVLNPNRVAWLHPNITIRGFTGSYYDVYNNFIECKCNAYAFSIGGNGNTVFAGKLINPNSGTIFISLKDEGHTLIEDNVRITAGGSNVSILSYWCSNLTIGSGSSFSPVTSIVVFSCGEINIGRDCLFANDIKVYAGDGHAIYDINTGENINSNPDYKERNKVVLDNHVWIGREAFLINCNIGSGSIVGARSLVKKSYPNNCIVAGVPAKVIKKDVGWSQEINCLDAEDPIFGIPKDYRHLTKDSL